MNEKKERSILVESLCRMGKGIDFVRRLVLNIVFILIVIFILSWFYQPGPSVPDASVLVLAPRGDIVEELSLPDITFPVEDALGLVERESLLKNLMDAIDASADDERIKVILLDLRGLGSAGLTKLQDLGGALRRFRKSGKKVIAYSDFYTRNSYYLAAYADEIAIDPMGIMFLEGYSHYERYYKEALDVLGVEVNVVRVGKYKSAVEPYIRNDMSDEAREANLRWLGVLWDAYLNDVSTARGIKREQLEDYIENFQSRLSAAGGDTAKAAKEAGLVDQLFTGEQLKNQLNVWTGSDKGDSSYPKIDYLQYLEALDCDRWGEEANGDGVGIIVARGSIVDGYQPPGNIGGYSTAALIRQARLDHTVKALVVRLDTGGGSTFASELIRRELDLVREKGKPVVISMGSVTASGGYWVSMAADEVWAYPTTITGSIGIYGIYPTFQETLKKYFGTHVDGVATTKIAGVMRLDRKMSPEAADVFQMIINKGYDDFINLVAKRRNRKPDEIHEIAQGRVWIGADAHKMGLIDQLGNLDDAVDAAAKRAKLTKPYKIKYIRPDLSSRQKLVAQLVSKTREGKTEEFPDRENFQPYSPLAQTARGLIRQVKQLALFNDPRGIYAYCLYDLDF